MLGFAQLFKSGDVVVTARNPNGDARGKSVSSDGAFRAAQPRVDAARIRALFERSELAIAVLDRRGVVVATSARAREVLPRLATGEPLPDQLPAPLSRVSVDGGETLLLFED